MRDNGTAASVDYMGVNWTLSATNGVGAGIWTLTLTDPAPADLPLMTDLMVVLKGGTSWSAYLFGSELFTPADLTNNGTFCHLVPQQRRQHPGAVAHEPLLPRRHIGRVRPRHAGMP